MFKLNKGNASEVLIIEYYETTLVKNFRNIHPGEIWLEEFLIPLEISAYRLSKDIDILQPRISKIVKGRRIITADTAFRLSKFFGNSAKFLAWPARST